MGSIALLDVIKLIVTGLGLGILVAAPVGPVNIICIQRALQRGFLAGILAGLGATIADGVIALAAASGLAAISEVMANYKVPLQFFGGLVLIAFGLKLMRTRPTLGNVDTADPSDGIVRMALTVPQTFFLTITNPGAILGMFALVGGAGTAYGGFETYTQVFLLVGFVMLGSLLWWTFLSGIVSRLRHRISDAGLLLINEIAGLLLIIFGVVLISRAAVTLSGGLG
ncbi:MAG: LysE family transporter [Pseudomonadota bacterium]